MAVYGIRGAATHAEHGRRTIRKEIEARDAGQAREFFRGWFAVEGYERPEFEVITSGTFRAHMTRELTNAGARLSLSHGAVVVGPWEREPRYRGDEPRSIMRLMLPNGWGVSLSSKLLDGFGTDTEMVTGHESLDGEDWQTDFSAGVMEYESRIMIAEEYDSEIGDVLRGLAALPSA
jgi:hypothetical protein